jgi:hypothetical protein
LAGCRVAKIRLAVVSGQIYIVFFSDASVLGDFLDIIPDVKEKLRALPELINEAFTRLSQRKDIGKQHDRGEVQDGD